MILLDCIGDKRHAGTILLAMPARSVRAHSSGESLIDFRVGEIAADSNTTSQQRRPRLMSWDRVFIPYDLSTNEPDLMPPSPDC